jgi:hypothetical protein
MPKDLTDDIKTKRKPKNLFKSAIQTSPVKDDITEYMERRMTIPAMNELYSILDLH